MDINSNQINGDGINGPGSYWVRFTVLLEETSSLSGTLRLDVSFAATITETSGLTGSLTDSDLMAAMLVEISGLTGTLTEKGQELTATITMTSRFSGSLNMPIRLRTDIARAIQIPCHGEVVS